MGTYAILLFEMGRLEDATSAEERAVALIPEREDARAPARAAESVPAGRA